MSIKLALSGYYQKAFVHVRDILETYFLVDYLRSNPAQISVCKNAHNKTLKKDFGPRRIREELDKGDGYTQQERKKFYDLVHSMLPCNIQGISADDAGGTWKDRAVR